MTADFSLPDDPQMSEEYALDSIMWLKERNIRGKIRRIALGNNLGGPACLLILPNGEEYRVSQEQASEETIEVTPSGQTEPIHEIEDPKWSSEKKWEPDSAKGYVISHCDSYNWIVSYNGIAVLNYQDLEKEAEAYAHEYYEENPNEVIIHSHHVFSCPFALAQKAHVLQPGMRVRGTFPDGVTVQGRIESGHWTLLNVISETDGRTYPFVPVQRLKLLMTEDKRERKKK